MTYKINLDLKEKEKIMCYINHINYSLENKIPNDISTLFFFQKINKIEINKEEYDLNITDNINNIDDYKKNILISTEKDFFNTYFDENIIFLNEGSINNYNLTNVFNKIFNENLLSRIYQKVKN